jgi:hypothetical protein
MTTVTDEIITELPALIEPIIKTIPATPKPTSPTRDCGLRGEALARHVLQIIKENPEIHDQSSWATITAKSGVRRYDCGTSYCMAGLIVHEAGYDMVLGFDPERYESGAAVAVEWCVPHDVNFIDHSAIDLISDTAHKLLRIDDRGTLFADGNSLAQLEWLVDQLYADPENVLE